MVNFFRELQASVFPNKCTICSAVTETEVGGVVPLPAIGDNLGVLVAFYTVDVKGIVCCGCCGVNEFSEGLKDARSRV